MPLLFQLWVYATPIAYTAELVPTQWRWVYALNPLVSVVQGFRWALLGQGGDWAGALLVALLVTAALVVTGVMYFQRVEDTFADVI
jgi:lipopolysaccharide transport system permease protein